MGAVLRFGIPSLDKLFGRSLKTDDGAVTKSKNRPARIEEAGRGPDSQDDGIQLGDDLGPSSITIIGPDGTGKSALGLHLASQYVADCQAASESRWRGSYVPRVLYVSTDLTYTMAERMWKNFALDWPNARQIPFEGRVPDKDAPPKVKLTQYSPLGQLKSEDLSMFLGETGNSKEPKVGFVDLASSTAGDDWGFINRVLAVLPTATKQPRHLMIVDSVEGFETLVGDKDAFGEAQPRRSRIAQVMRSASNKCHIAFVVEESSEQERLPEEFVTDVVIRLRSTQARDYVRRTIEIKKVRGQSHVRGQHPYVIRAGRGSTTGIHENPDDPAVEQAHDAEKGETRPRFQSYIHVCRSLHNRSRNIMEETVEEGKPSETKNKYASFGIPYLDDMLAGDNDNATRREGADARGLPCSTITALIGDAGTQKSRLGTAFLSGCFRAYAERFRDTVDRHLRTKVSSSSETVDRRPQSLKDRICTTQKGIVHALESMQAALKESNWRPALDSWRSSLRSTKDVESLDDFTEEVSRSSSGDQATGRVREAIKNARLLEQVSRGLGIPRSPDDGVPVLLTTQDVHADAVARHFLHWLMSDVPGLNRIQHKFPGAIDVLKTHMAAYTVCRRLEIHDLPAAILIHIMDRAINKAQRLLLGEEPPPETQARFEKSWGIRVVFNDMSIIRHIYTEVYEDPLVLPFIVFYLGREGVTSLMIDTQSGRPDTTVIEPFDSELRALVNNCLYTWRFPFFGEDRVAIAAIPPISNRLPVLIRELRRESDPKTYPLTVDPHFELYSGIEERSPKPVPLEVRLYAETPAFSAYIERENANYRELFTPVGRASKSGPSDILVGVPAGAYDDFRDFCYLQHDTRLDYTLVFQVDEFWALRQPEARRTGAFRPQWGYLSVATAKDNGEPDLAVDPFRVFQGTKSPRTASSPRETSQKPGGGEPGEQPKKKARLAYFSFPARGYELPLQEGEQAFVDRVPFTWDFGFLMCRKRAWEDLFNLEDKEDKEFPLWQLDTKTGRGEVKESRSVKDVWDRLPKPDMTERGPKEGDQHRQGGLSGAPSWREFLGACHAVARAQTARMSVPVKAFDVSIVAPQTFSCLVLEMWASEILDSLSGEEKAAFIERMFKRHWNLKEDEGLLKWLLPNKEGGHRLELFKTRLLLVEALDLTEFADAVRVSDLSAMEPDPSAIAVRHWYKTACESSQSFSPTDPVIPVRLPGHFTVRGDWFLAVAGGSRSGRLADRVLDLLSSRRSNIGRVERGLGLPTRDVISYGHRLDVDSQLHTNLFGPGPNGRKKKVLYADLLNLGAGPDVSPKGFNWFWRSSLRNYHRHAKIWQKWLNNMILWSHMVQYRYKDEWVSGFERYDLVSEDPDRALETLGTWEKFNRMCDSLLDDLSQATLGE